MSGITTHVLDTAKGKPGVGINIVLEKRSQVVMKESVVE